MLAALTPKVVQTLKSLSRYAQRARQIRSLDIARRHCELRYDLQCGSLQVSPALASAWGRELARAAAYRPPEITHALGLLSLRQQICDYLMRRRGVCASPDQIMIVSGAQQALTLAGRVLLDEGDMVVLEEPHNFSVYESLVAHGAHVCPVRIDGDGLVCAELPSTPPSLICVTPAHQFPGGELSLLRRLELLRYADRHRCWIVEDDYDGELRYDSHTPAALRSLDESDRVIYIGTFSKMLYGTLPLAYMVLPTTLLDDFVNAKHFCDIACSDIEQAALAHFMEDGGFERHLRRVHREQKARREALLDGLRYHAGDRVEIVGTPAGMYVVTWLNGYDDARVEAFIAHAHERGLGLYSIAPHYVNPPVRAGLLLGFAGLSVAALHEAMQLFGECLEAVPAQLS